MKEERDNVFQLKVLCAECKREIVDGMVYFHDKEKGYICECCPGFEKGGITLPPEER